MLSQRGANPSREPQCQPLPGSETMNQPAIKQDQDVPAEQRFAPADIRAFAVDVMRNNGVDAEQIETVADAMMWCELVGRPNFGISRLPVLMRRIEAGVINTPCRLSFEETAPAVHMLDGNAGFGHHVATRATERAIELAHNSGVGVVAVRNSNFFGANAYFINMAAEAGMAAMVLTNSFPKVTAHGGIKPVMGTNPFAFGVPLGNGRRSLLVDMATAASAGSLIREYQMKGMSLPPGIAIDADGNPITDPAKVASGTMLPFGGAKGYGLALMVEILSGVITGAGICHGVTSMYNNFERSADIGHFILVLDLKRFMPAEILESRMDQFVASIRGAGADGDVLLPGEVRWRHHDDNLANGIPVAAGTQKMLEPLIQKDGLTAPWTR